MRSYAMLICNEDNIFDPKISDIEYWFMDTDVEQFSDQIQRMCEEHHMLEEYYESNFTPEALGEHEAGRYTLGNYVLLIQERP